MTIELKRAAAKTKTQQLAKAQALEQQHSTPDTSTIVYQWPDGWTMRQLKTYADMNREGELMGNCFGLYSTEFPHLVWRNHPYVEESYDEDYDDYEIDRPDAIENWNISLYDNYGPFYSLRDPDNLPHASVDTQADNPTLGKHNTILKPEHMQRIREWEIGAI